LPLRHLVEVGLVLGADVPVFLRGHSAWAEGIGEQLTPVDWPIYWYLVVVPPQSVSTAAVFADPTLTRDSAPATISDFRSGGLENDCLPVVRRRYPAVARAMDWLSRYGEARLTGTGGCVFAAYASHDEADHVLGRVPAGWMAFVAKGLNRSPLHAFLGDNE
jgi:4-diphosphocytidyl-2-C-methyl-D-erythritol kinase